MKLIPCPITGFLIIQTLCRRTTLRRTLWPSLTSSSGSTRPWCRCPPCQSCGPLWGCLYWCPCSLGPSYSNACSGTGWPGTLRRLRSPRRAQPPPDALYGEEDTDHGLRHITVNNTKKRPQGLVSSNRLRRAGVVERRKQSLYVWDKAWMQGLEAVIWQRLAKLAGLKRQHSGLSRSCWCHMMEGERKGGTGFKAPEQQVLWLSVWRQPCAHKWIWLMESCLQVTVQSSRSVTQVINTLQYLTHLTGGFGTETPLLSALSLRTCRWHYWFINLFLKLF